MGGTDRAAHTRRPREALHSGGPEGAADSMGGALCAAGSGAAWDLAFGGLTGEDRAVLESTGVNEHQQVIVPVDVFIILSSFSAE